MLEDFKICRACLAEVTDYKCLFNVHYINEEKLRLSEMFTASTAIEVLEYDDLPKQVCIKCENSILNVFSFQKLCRKSDLVLKGILSESVQPQLELKPSSSSSQQDNVNHLAHKVEKSGSYLNESIKDHLSSGKILNEESGCLESTDRSLGSDDIIFIEQEHTSDSFNGENQAEEETIHKELHTYKEDEAFQQLSSLKNENNSSSSYHTESVNSQHVELRPSGILSTRTSEQDQVNDLDEDTNAQLTSVKILEEDNDDDEMNLRDQGEKLYCCSTCGKAFFNSSDLTRHSRRHSGGVCNYCGKDFVEFRQLSHHMKCHTKPFQCNLCIKGFSTRKDLAKHIEVHKRKKYSCDTCGKLFSDNSKLILHSRIHSGETPYVCTYCGEGFLKQHVLTKHVEIHTGEGSHVCYICHKRYRSRDSFRKHMAAHTEVRTDERACDICHIRFSQKETLRKHMALHIDERNHLEASVTNGSP